MGPRNRVGQPRTKGRRTDPPCLTVRQVRRLALVRAGLLKPEWTHMPKRARDRGKRARAAAEAVIRRFGYLQLDTVSIAGARSHVIILLSRVEGIDPALGEELLRPGAPYFEYWGHEASWLPMDLYPAFEFRRQEFRHHPWWGDLIGEHPEVARGLIERIRNEGPLRSVDMEGAGSSGWWDLKLAKRVATALWSSGELAIRERCGFQRSYDLAERVIPHDVRARPMSQKDGIAALLLRALDGHGWATLGTLAATWRLRNRQAELRSVLADLEEAGEVIPCALEADGSRPTPGWIRPRDLELAERLDSIRPRRDQGVLLSPFDPVLWDRQRVQQLFGFDQVLEIFKPSPARRYGYYCLPVLAGEHLVARLDLKAHRKRGILEVLSCHFEMMGAARLVLPRDREAARSALERYSAAVALEPVGWPTKVTGAGYRA